MWGETVEQMLKQQSFAVKMESRRRNAERGKEK